MLTQTWDPFREMEMLRRDVERAFESALSGTGRAAQWPRLGQAFRAYPPANLSEDSDHYYVHVMAPGLDPEHIEVTAHGNQIRIAGEKQALSEEIQSNQFLRNERSAGRFTRTMTLPAEINADKVSAEYKNGVLRLTLPKAEAAKPRQISVSVN